jgi:hypothetical protein
VKDGAKIIEYRVRVLIDNKFAFGNCNIHPLYKKMHPYVGISRTNPDDFRTDV